MSDQPQAVILHSNTYFRLACSIRPLLKGSFGDAPRYTLYVLAALDEEYLKNVRLHYAPQQNRSTTTLTNGPRCVSLLERQ